MAAAGVSDLRIPTSGAPRRIVEGALRQAREAATYDPEYVRMGYPGGDLDRHRGACTDVVVRALRAAGYDLQRLIHEDMRTRFRSYPRREARPDPNIDHRRCPNQAWFFRRYGRTLPTAVGPATLAQWRPGDLVYWKLPNGLDHTGVLSDRIDSRGVPFVVHNLARCVEEDVLTRWKVVGHYRYPGRPPRSG